MNQPSDIIYRHNNVQYTYENFKLLIDHILSKDIAVLRVAV